MARRREMTPFDLAFLDVMFCGFGAVVLLVMLLNGKTIADRDEKLVGLRSEVLSLERALTVDRRMLENRRETVVRTERQLTERRAEIEHARTEMAQLAALIQSGDREAARRARIEALQAELRRLDVRVKELKASESEIRGNQALAFAGDGDRQYLTGLKIGGQRVLILLDASASMLDRTIVNVIRLRNMDPDVRRMAEKWQRAMLTTHWLLSNLPPRSQFQVYAFNTRSRPVVEGTSGQWFRADDRDAMAKILTAIDELVPNGGTSLINAFASAGDMMPPPDNILLLTDGLPTQGRTPPQRTTVSGQQRLRHFRQAVLLLGTRVPVNTILFPMEGDPVAAAAFWQLATQSRGSFLTPSKDWP